MSKVSLYLYLGEKAIDRPLSRRLRDRAAGLSFGEGGFVFADVAPTEKPRFVHPKGAFFNVTHSENIFLMAVSDAEVGLDVQTDAGFSARQEKIAARVFSEEEQKVLFSLPQEKRAGEFARLWTMHEASAKYSGRGLSELLGGTLGDLVYTDLGELFASLGIFAACTLATAKVPELLLCFLED